ncbi:hypothetical protein [Streptomyces sp. NRRL WC-3742]|uniref:hypothetical protein n=1 Tax=Streptomyces sp. NRRL WC-3742 TaxID=1463934 RepID=UPI0004C89200|nr:hypothetical protein [Streptomyces sp. NRRL WC-3742]
MTETTGDSAASPSPGTKGVRPGRGRWDRSLLWFALLLLGLPPLLHLVKADLLGLLVIWGAAATLIRSSASAFDRVMISGVTLIGWTCALGVVASRWPWGLNPLALAETTAVVVVAVRAVRGPAPARKALPLGARLRALVPTRDIPLLLCSGFAFAFSLYPVLQRSAVERLALIFRAEDLGRHIALYDSILRFGGLASLHQDKAVETVQQGLATYPQGSHLMAAVLTTFLYGKPERLPGPDQVSLFVVLYTVMFAAMIVAILWAVRRAAGPALRGWRTAALMLPVTAFLLVAEMPKMYMNGFISEIFALGLLAVLVAVAIRPLGRIHEQVVVLGALTVGISFGHYLLLPAAGITVLGWAAVHLRLWKRHWVSVLAASAVTGAFALLPIFLNRNTEAGSADALTLQGGIGPVGRHVLFPLVAATVVVLLTPAARANRARRVALVSGGAIVALCYGLMRYQVWKTNGTSYFYEKLLHQLLVIGLVTMAAALLPLLGRRFLAGAGDASRPARRAGLRTGIAVLATTGVLTFAVISDSQPDVSSAAGWDGSPGRQMIRGAQARWDVAERVDTIYRSQPAGHPKIAVSLAGHRAWGDPAADWGSVEDNLWLGVLNKDQGKSWKPWAWTLTARPAQEILNVADTWPDPLRFYLDDDKQIAELKALAAKGKHPNLDVWQLKRDAHGTLVAEPLRLG